MCVDVLYQAPSCFPAPHHRDEHTVCPDTGERCSIITGLLLNTGLWSLLVWQKDYLPLDATVIKLFEIAIGVATETLGAAGLSERPFSHFAKYT